VDVDGWKRVAGEGSEDERLARLAAACSYVLELAGARPLREVEGDHLSEYERSEQAWAALRERITRAQAAPPAPTTPEVDPAQSAAEARRARRLKYLRDYGAARRKRCPRCTKSMAKTEPTCPVCGLEMD
jgi:hypothetical protein